MFLIPPWHVTLSLNTCSEIIMEKNGDNEPENQPTDIYQGYNMCNPTCFIIYCLIAENISTERHANEGIIIPQGSLINMA